MLDAAASEGDRMEEEQNAKAASSDAPHQHVELTLASTLDSISEIEHMAEQMALRAGFDEDTASNIAMVSREAAINAVKHGNKFAPDKKVSAVLDCPGVTMTVVIADEGEGLDPATLPDPLDPANLLCSSGRGVFLMRAMADEVHFRQLRPGTEVTLIKHRDMEANS